MANPRFIQQLFNYDLTQVIDVNGHDEARATTLFLQDLTTCILEQIPLNLFLSNIQIRLYNLIIKNFLLSYSPTVLGLEHIAKPVITEILSNLPVSVAVIGVNHLTVEAMMVIYDGIKNLKDSGRPITVICGNNVSIRDQARFKMLNEAPINLVSPTLPATVDSPEPEFSPVRGRVNQSRKRFRSRPNKPAGDDPVEVVYRLAIENKALREDNASMHANLLMAENHVTSLTCQLYRAKKRIAELKQNSQPSLNKISETKSEPLSVRPFFFQVSTSKA